MQTDDTALASHYAFGENWSEFARSLGESAVERAVEGMERLVPRERMAGTSFIDIGCGSGLSSLAALRLGARSVAAYDLDPASVRTTRAVLDKFAPNADWRAEEVSVFDLSAERIGRFDIVHSWGVLHHTGAMWRAIERALDLVAPGGMLVLALYRKSPLCGFWRVEKRFYTHAGVVGRGIARGLYQTLYLAGVLATGRNPAAYVRDYEHNRGMAWRTDVEDWLGGYPYESVTPQELDAFLTPRGFVRESIYAKPARLGGLFGSHCDEFVYRRV